MHTFGSNRRKSSQRNKRSRPFGKLTIDTKCASQGRTFPYESRVLGLSFVSFEESKARKNGSMGTGELKQQLENRTPIHPGPKRTLPAPVAQLAPTDSAPPGHDNHDATRHDGLSRQDSLAVPLNKRIKGLRPSPLDLSNDVSPSDQAITIGMTFSPSTVSNYTRTPNSPILPRSPDACPVIVITPAKEKFSPEVLAQNAQRRPASSVYSSYTNCMSNSRGINNAPPVPPLPSFINTKAQKSWFSDFSRDSAITSFEEDLPSARSRHIPASTRLDDVHADNSVRQSTLSASALPTPRRSKGWWNVITSPFSAKSAGTSFWKSSSPRDAEDDAVPILGEAATMGNSHDGVIFINRTADDDELRSAPAAVPDDFIDADTKPVPKRADTAPGALDMHAVKLNIYRIPSSGEAAAYYNTDRHFPSLCGDSASRAIGDSDGDAWSPSQSVFMPMREGSRSSADWHTSMAPSSAHTNSPECEMVSRDGKDQKEPIVTPAPEVSRGIAAGPTIFSTPTEDELQSAGLSRPLPKRGLTEATMTSQFSRLSATPIVQDAQMARFAGPETAFGEQKQVQVEQQAPTPSYYGLGFATMGAATIDHGYEQTTNRGYVEFERPIPRPAHVRQDSHGLGISDAESDLWPPPQPLCEKPRLGTDRFGQLTVRNFEMQKPARPWWHRFFWLLAAGKSILLLLMIVLMVVLIPQRHVDMSVQASWVNLTGFPAMPVGISTVISPEKTQARNTCVTPSNLWSCTPPGLGDSSLPDFRFETRFRNGTLPKNETMFASSSIPATKRWQDTSALHKFVRRSLWSDYLYSPSPSPPSKKDQEFLGQYADNTSEPYNGEETPFYMSLLDAEALSPATTKLRIRDDSFKYPYPDASDESSTATTDDIPRAAKLNDGKPVGQVLYPYATAQPLRLFDRGKDTEHYGFYTYFDRSIYVTNLTTNISTSSNFTSNVPLTDASAICTFSQTRLHLQIWTRKKNPRTANLVVSSTTNSTANAMTSPGSFPYAVTITLDRHGGSADKKGVYCYGLDSSSHRIVDSAKIWIAEDRAAGGTIVNAASVTNSSSSTVSERDTEYSGIDGGTGGCNCAWRNWE